MNTTEFTDVIDTRLIKQLGNDLMVCAAAWASTDPDTALKAMIDEGEIPEKKIAGTINYLMAHRHGTPFEHGCMIHFVDAPIFVWREHHRHRVGWSYNEESGRYKQLRGKFHIPRPDRNLIPVPDPGDKCPAEVQFVPGMGTGMVCGGPLVKQDNGTKTCQVCQAKHRYHTSARPFFGPAPRGKYLETIADLKDAYSKSYGTYLRLLESGVAKETARECLPVSTYSRCWTTCNPRSMMAFLSLRTHEPDALKVSYPQAEIEQVARVYEESFKTHWPLTYEAFNKNGRLNP